MKGIRRKHRFTARTSDFPRHECIATIEQRRAVRDSGRPLVAARATLHELQDVYAAFAVGDRMKLRRVPSLDIVATP